MEGLTLHLQISNNNYQQMVLDPEIKYQELFLTTLNREILKVTTKESLMATQLQKQEITELMQ
jgi:hypothetical protein